MIQINDVSELPKVPTTDEQKNVYQIYVDKFNYTNFAWQPYPQNKGFKELGRWIVFDAMKNADNAIFIGYCFATQDKFPKYPDDKSHSSEITERAKEYTNSGYDPAIASRKAIWDYFDVLGAYPHALYVDTNDGNVYCTDSADNWQWPYDLEKYIATQRPNNGNQGDDGKGSSQKDTKTSLDR